MRKIFLIAALALTVAVTGCHKNTRHFISDAEERAMVEHDYAEKCKLVPGVTSREWPDLKKLGSVEDEELYKFLYAYLPLADLLDYDFIFWQENVKQTLATRKEMPWGTLVPEREFRHFVLPVRVNNENLDYARLHFYKELKDRVIGLSMYDAILEVNHWCHEKAVYRPSDARTSAPMATVKTAYGRCGEESTLLVAALRSVGIPARQVYTPRWAHTDDNHAWVEAWANGKWYFLGACEPEPVLNLGWFNAPASRGMLMHTKVFGHYAGPEEVMSRNSCYTEINVVKNYAPCSMATVTVKDPEGKAVEGARVDFKIYNYAEFYSAARKVTDAEGQCTLTAGHGDMLVWATDGARFGFQKLSFGQQEALTVVLDHRQGEAMELPFDMVPPKENAKPVKVKPELRDANNKRLQQEDKLRKKYTDTFLTETGAEAIARTLQLDPKVAGPILVKSCGNHGELVTVLEAMNGHDRELALTLLQEVTEKDLRDITPEVLEKHVMETPVSEDALFARYVLNPRIANEQLTPYKAILSHELAEELDVHAVKENPEVLKEWCLKHLTLLDALNPQQIEISPVSVWRERYADTHSRDIFFVAALRSLGVPARIHAVNGKVQYADSRDEWQDVEFEAVQTDNRPQGTLTAGYTPVKALADPVYYSHFTLGRFEEGTFRLLTFPEDGSCTWSRILKEGMPLDTGYYMLTTGTRLASGAVLSQVKCFNIRAGKEEHVTLEMRENPDEVKVIGSFNSEAQFLPQGKSAPQSILQTTGRGYFITAILGARQEPTNHALRDIAALAKDFEEWGRGMVLLFPDEGQLKNFDAGEFPGLPKTITFGIDQDNKIQRMMMENLHLESETLPIFVVADTFNRVVFFSQGYTIGLGEQLMKTIHKISE